MRDSLPASSLRGEEVRLQLVIALQDPIIKQVKHLPAYWPPTQEDNWLVAQAEVFARDIQSIEDLEAFTNRVAVDINAWLKKGREPNLL